MYFLFITDTTEVFLSLVLHTFLSALLQTSLVLHYFNIIIIIALLEEAVLAREAPPV